MKVTVVVAAWNEFAAIPPLLRALGEQTRAADEILLADGGSSDGTQDLARTLAAQRRLPLKVLDIPGKIATGRNFAVRSASGSVIAVTDADCRPEADWLEKIVAPIEAGAIAASGSYRAVTSCTMERAIAVFTWVPQEPGKNFLPSHRSVAYLRETWERIGGYREDIDSGEDTLFDIEVRKLGGFAQAPDACVDWKPRRTLTEALRQQLFYGGGDGQARIQIPYHAACGGFLLCEILALCATGPLRLAGAFAVILALVYFLRKHTALFGLRIDDWPATFVLLLVLPGARFLGFVLGVCGVSVRALLRRS